ncbi:uncharacterized protein BDV14DRAFT_199875 [Aspergillus stella-maris]|uniref:uncharacterized protein n=1 Tax=Aspergillus stella-maris TaxID=1810926 RepID=UPI003CCD6EE8
MTDENHRRSSNGQLPESQEFLHSLENLNLAAGEGSHNDFNFITHPQPYPPCTKPIADLKRVTLRDCALKTRHNDSYLVLRAIYSVASGRVLVNAEDQDGDLVVLYVSGQEEVLVINAELRGGTVMVIKQPCVGVVRGRARAIRVDHVSDVVFLPLYDEHVPACWRSSTSIPGVSVNSWKEEGNLYFRQKRYREAIESYSKGLETSSTVAEAVPIRSNRALAYIRSQQFDHALHDAEQLLAENNMHEKALQRKAAALYYLGQFRESCDTYKALARAYPENKAVKDEFNRAIARLSEHQSGKFPFQQMQQAAENNPRGTLDYATYVGPVAVQPTESCGNGLFTTAPVKAGDLLFCEKAIVYHPNGNKAKLRGFLVQKLYKTPSLHSKIADLDHGEYQRVELTEVDGKPVVDSFLVSSILERNCFKCPHSSAKTLRHAQRIGEASVPERSRALGLWLLASSISHSCVENANSSFIGDMMILRAVNDIDENTEITITCTSP